MALKDQINHFFHSPVMKSLRNRIRRILPTDLGQRKLQMPVLETERLVLRQLDQDDLRDITAWEEVTSAQNNDVAAQEFLDYCFREYRERGIGPWGIQLKETGAIVGNCGFPDIVLKKLFWTTKLDYDGFINQLELLKENGEVNKSVDGRELFGRMADLSLLP